MTTTIDEIRAALSPVTQLDHEYLRENAPVWLAALLAEVERQAEVIRVEQDLCSQWLKRAADAEIEVGRLNREVDRLTAEVLRMRGVLLSVNSGDCQEMPPKPPGCECQVCIIERALVS